MRRPARWLAVLAIGALGATAQSPAGRAAGSWRRVDTPHFTVIGSIADRELADVAIEFERFRDALAQLLPSAATATIVPAVAIVFESEKAFDPFRPLAGGKPRESDGAIVSSPDIEYIALIAGSRGFRDVFHQYTHLIIANLRVPPPLWLNEGLAEYYSTFEARRGARKATIGEPLTSHLATLRSEWMKLDELRALQVDSRLYHEDERRSVLYAESWALVHYFLHGTPPPRGYLEKYLSAVEAGTAEEEAWSRFLGSQGLENGLRDYLDRSQSRMTGATLDSRLETVTATGTPLSESDADAFLGDFLARGGREADAKARLQPAAERQPGAARARSALARLLAGEKQAADARALLTRAASPAGDWLADYAFAVAVADLFAVEPREGAAESAAAREALQRVLRARPDLAHASHLLAGFALQAGELDAARDASESAAFLAPGRVEYTIRLAEVFTRRREYAKARSVLGPLMTNPRAAGVRERVRTQLAAIAEAERAAAEASNAAPAAEVPTAGPVLDLRRLQSGEERTAGMLARIECDRKKGVTFHIRVDSRTEEYRAARFQDVEFVSYRDDLLGEMKCGAREPEDLVYVTWKDGAPAAAGAPASKTIVAVEFLPKDFKPKN
jgi:tetratricopeptide (TPR) repeat protein